MNLFYFKINMLFNAGEFECCQSAVMWRQLAVKLNTSTDLSLALMSKIQKHKQNMFFTFLFLNES